MLLGAPARRLSWLRSVQAQHRGWICQSCRSRTKFIGTSTGTGTGRKPFSSSSSVLQEVKAEEVKVEEDKPYYVTTPIFYVNATPHIGHLYSMLLADALKRWEALRGKRRAIMCTGTDEHGIKVQQAAQRQEVTPKALCDTNAAAFRDLAKWGGIAYDRFVRTSEEDHVQAVRHFWTRLREGGHLYETQRAGWYSVSDEAFVPEALVERRFEPFTGRQIVVASESGSVVEWCEERNYHFRLTAMRDRLLRFYEENPDWVTPPSRMAEVVDWVRNHLEDLSVSRPVERLDWGIQVPGDHEQTIYVWVDALVNYLTTTGYPKYWSEQPKRGIKVDAWPADVHVIGKDIVRFHCVYWPALLLALDLPLPRRVLSHAHWLINARKISKSTGNVINPFVAIRRWGLDPLRYFLLSAGGIAHDADYANEIIAQRYKKALKGGLGNLLSRLTKPTTWNARDAIVATAAAGGVVPEIGSGSGSGATASAAQSSYNSRLDGAVNTHLEHLNAVVGRADAQIAELNPGAALREVMEFVFETNRFFSNATPWDDAKAGNTASLHRTIYVTAESLRIAGILLQPFMPGKAAELLDRLGVSLMRRSLDDARLGADYDYGVPSTETETPLFPPLFEDKPDV